MDVELKLQFITSQMHIEQIKFFVKLTTSDSLIDQVSKEVQLKSDQFSLFLIKYGFQIRIIHGWDCEDIEPLDILTVRVLDPNLKFGLRLEENYKKVDYTPYFYTESHNDKQINLYDTFVDNIKFNKIEYIQKHMNREIINQVNNEGWTLLHWACYFGKLEILYLIVPFANDLNLATLDGWTPLMISIRQSNYLIAKYLLNQSSININIVTQQSSALHIACRMENVKIIEMLQEKDVDFLVVDQQNNYVYNIASLKIQLYLMALINKMPQVTEIQLFSQINPFIARGTYHSPGNSPWSVKERYLLINPQGDHLIRYKDKLQEEIRESIKLSQIQQVNQNYTSFKLKKGYCYIQLIADGNHEIIIGLQTTVEVQRWTTVIKRGITFARNAISGLQLNNIFVQLEDIDLDQPPINQQVKRESQTPQRRKVSDISSLMPKLSHQIPKFKDFAIKSLLTHDQVSCVFKVKCELDGSIYALKCLNKDLLIKNNLLKEAIQEVQILTSINNPFIISLQYAFQTPNYLYLAFQHCNGGSLFSILNILEKVTENQAKFYLSQILFALEYLHSLNIVYNNLQLENVLLTSKGSIKLIGLQNYRNQSIYYLTPECLAESKIGYWTDYYQFGIMAYELLSGVHPFQGKSVNQITLSILMCDIEFPPYFSKEAVSFITKLTNKSYEKRMCFAEVRQHPFFKDTQWEQYFNQKFKPPILLNQLRNNLKSEKITFQDEDYNLHEQSNFKKIINYDYIKFT